MVEEPFFTLPATIAPTVQDTVVPTPIASSPVATMNEREEPILEEPIEPNVAHEEEQQQPNMEQVPEAPRRSQRIRRSAITDDYEVYETEEFQMGDDPTSFEEAMRSDHSSKWLKAMEDELKSMSTNKVWDLENISKGAKTVGCKWVYKTKYDSQENIERFKRDLWQKASRKEKELITMRRFLQSHVKIPSEL